MQNDKKNLEKMAFYTQIPVQESYIFGESRAVLRESLVLVTFPDDAVVATLEEADAFLLGVCLTAGIVAILHYPVD